MPKPLQQDSEGRIMNDTVTKETQKGYSNYEKEQKRAQAEREAKDKEDPIGLKFWGDQIKQTFLGQSPVEKAKGGVIKKFRHHDGIAQKGKTRA
jgi:hypothetical protein